MKRITIFSLVMLLSVNAGLWLNIGYDYSKQFKIVKKDTTNTKHCKLDGKTASDDTCSVMVQTCNIIKSCTAYHNKAADLGSPYYHFRLKYNTAGYEFNALLPKTRFDDSWKYYGTLVNVGAKSV